MANLLGEAIRSTRRETREKLRRAHEGEAVGSVGVGDANTAGVAVSRAARRREAAELMGDAFGIDPVFFEIDEELFPRRVATLARIMAEDQGHDWWALDDDVQDRWLKMAKFCVCALAGVVLEGELDRVRDRLRPSLAELERAAAYLAGESTGEQESEAVVAA